MMLMIFILLVEMNILVNGICIIEWGELIENILPNDYIKISFERDKDDENIRIINVQINDTSHNLEGLF